MPVFTPYLVVVSLFAVLAFFSEKATDKTRTVLNIACSIVFLLFFGLRGDVGWDYAGYCARFYDLGWNNIGDFFLHHDSVTAMEPGFVLCVILCRYLCPNFHFFLFLCTAFTYFLTCKFISANVRNMPWALVIFFCMGGLLLHTDFIRSAVCMALFMYSIRYIEERKLKMFLLLNLIGLSFHVSALLYIPLYFLYGVRIPNWIFLCTGLAGTLLLFFNIPLASYISIFIDKVLWGTDNVILDLCEFSILPTIQIGAVERLATGSLLLWCHRQTCRWYNSDRHRFYLLLFFLYYFFSSFLWDFPIIAMRFSLMFSFVYCIIWISLPETASKSWKKIVFIAAIGIYMLLRLVVTTNVAVFRYTNVLLPC